MPQYWYDMAELAHTQVRGTYHSHNKIMSICSCRMCARVCVCAHVCGVRVRVRACVCVCARERMFLFVYAKDLLEFVIIILTEDFFFLFNRVSTGQDGMHPRSSHTFHADKVAAVVPICPIMVLTSARA